MKDARAIQLLFERYQRERTAFAGSLYELARHDANCESIEASGGAQLLQSLLTDPSPQVGIKRTAALALGRLASQSSAVANKIIADGAVRTLTELLVTPISDAASAAAETSRRREGLELRRAAAFTLRACCKHGTVISRAVIDAGALHAAAACLVIPDAETREAAAWLIDTLAGQGEALAQVVLDADAIPPLVSCLDYSEIALKRAAASALGSIAQHGPLFAHSVAVAGAIPPLAAVLQGDKNVVDQRLARHVLCALSQIIQGGKEFAQELLKTGALPAVVRNLASSDDLVQRFAASTLRDIACYDTALAQEVAGTQLCLQLLVQATSQTGKGLNVLPAVMALGHLSAATSSLAESVINAGGLTALAVVIAHNPEEPAKCAAAWAVGQIGRHSPLHAQAVAESGALLALTGLEVAATSSADLAAKCCKAVSSVIAELSSLPALDALLRMTVSFAVKSATLNRLSVVLREDNGPLRTSFVQNGGLQLIQDLAEESGNQFNVAAINAIFPPELVNMYSPSYNRQLLERVLHEASSATAPPPQMPLQVLPPLPPPPSPPPRQQQQIEAEVFMPTELELAPATADLSISETQEIYGPVLSPPEEEEEEEDEKEEPAAAALEEIQQNEEVVPASQPKRAASFVTAAQPPVPTSASSKTAGGDRSRLAVPLPLTPRDDGGDDEEENNNTNNQQLQSFAAE